MIRLTEAQKRVVDAPRGEILVSAAAGSGKTAVLAGRIVSRVLAGELDLQSVLVVTFTDAAARNMRARIEKLLREAAAETDVPEVRRRAAQQLAVLPAAAISTVHAFCLQIIRNFAYLARDEAGESLVDPGVAVDDGQISGRLLDESLAAMLDEAYERADSEPESSETAALLLLMEGYGDNRSDVPVRQLLQRQLHQLRSLPDYQTWIAGRLTALEETAADFSASACAAEFNGQLRLLVERAATALPELAAILAGGVTFYKTDRCRSIQFNQELSAYINALTAFANWFLAAEDPGWDEIQLQAEQLPDELKLPSSRATDTSEKRAFLDLFITQVSELQNILKGGFGTKKYTDHFLFEARPLYRKTAAQIEAEIQAMLPAVRCFYTMVLDLDQRFAAAKRNAGIIDFADFEHLALLLLRLPEVRSYCHQRFAEVYVDEYQDTSGIQDAIIQAVSSGSCLTVGDVKQSIYRFRHARPDLFLTRARQFRSGESGQLFELERNFRSVPGIISFVNQVFGRLMTAGAAEIAYTEGHAMTSGVCGEENPEAPERVGPAVSLLLACSQLTSENQTAPEPDDDADGEFDPEDAAVSAEDLNADEQESLIVRDEIVRLLDSGAFQPSDIAILTRTIALGQKYQHLLLEAGIAASAGKIGAARETPALRVVEQAIWLLDNARQDIPLAAVLRAGLSGYRFTVADMAQIKAFGRPQDLSFHESVLRYREQGPDPNLRSRLAHSLDWIDELRTLAPAVRVSELIGRICSDHGWEDQVALSPAGAFEVRQLRAFRQVAEQFEARRAGGVYAFARFLERQREQGQSSAGSEDTAENAVRIMTIHASKGLEFPVVFVVGCHKTFFGSRDNPPLQFAEGLGIGMDYADPERRVRFPTHLRLAVRARLWAANQAEEMRLLYVAMTRAEKRLYLSAALEADPEDGSLGLLVRQAAGCPSGPLPDYLIRKAKRYLDWLAMSLAEHQAVLAAVSRSAAGDSSTVQLGEMAIRVCADARLHPGRAAEQMTEAEPLPPEISPQGVPSIDDSVRQAQQGHYPFADAAARPIKLTVSELKRWEAQAQQLDEDTKAQLPPDLQGIGLNLQDAWPGGATGFSGGLELSDPDAVELASASMRSVLDGVHQRLTARDTGILLHQALRFLNLRRVGASAAATDLLEHLRDMERQAILTAAERSALEPFAGQLAAFARSELAAAIRQARRVYREIPFTLAIPASQIFAPDSRFAPEDQVLVQGIIDCWFVDDHGVTLIDYKSDRIPNDADLENRLRQRYATQLDYYARAIRAASGLDVDRRLIWHIPSARAIDFSDS